MNYNNYNISEYTLTVLEFPKSPKALLAIEYNLSLWGFPFLSMPSGIIPIDCPSL